MNDVYREYTLCPSCMNYLKECECSIVNPVEPVLTAQVIKSKAKKMQYKIEALKIEAWNVAAYLEDNGQGLASTNFLKIGDSLRKASEEARLLS